MSGLTLDVLRASPQKYRDLDIKLVESTYDISLSLAVISTFRQKEVSVDSATETGCSSGEASY